MKGDEDNLSGFGCGDGRHAGECSSSFGSTFSCSDDELKVGTCDVEVGSQLHAENAAFSFSDVCSIGSRKKKLTDHWRRFVRPLRWRCKWLELQMQQLHTQALKYERELLTYDQEKLLKVEMVTTDKSASRREVMKRQRRKKNEETVDISSYMSNHYLFSYYDRGYKADGLFLCDGPEHQAEQKNKRSEESYEWPMLDINDDDDTLENILLDIESLKSRILRMKVELCSMLTVFNAEISTSSLCVPTKLSFGSPLIPSCSSDDNVSSFGDPTHPNITEISRDLLLSVDCLFPDDHLLGGQTDDVAILNNQAAEGEWPYFNNVSLPIENPEDAVKKKRVKFAPAVSSSETESDAERRVMTKCPVSKPCTAPCTAPYANVRRSKRKRVERKLSPGIWIGEKIKKARSSRVRKKPFVRK